MANSHVIDASGVFPLNGEWRVVDDRECPNPSMVATWTEYLCVAVDGAGGSITICLHGAIGEGLRYGFDEFENSLLEEWRLPAFFEGEMVAVEEDCLLCGPLVARDYPLVRLGEIDRSTVVDALKELDWESSPELLEKILVTLATKRIETSLPASLIEAYLATNYRAEIPGGFYDLRIGDEAIELDTLFDWVGKSTAVFITAHNPMGRKFSDQENARRHAALWADVLDLRLPYFLGEGIGEDQTWAPERSILLFGLTLEQAIHLGRHHEQNAIVWAESGEPPKLVLLR